MSFEIPEQCINCPKIAPYIKGLEEAERTRSQTIASAEEFMAGEESGAGVTAELEEFLDQHEIILRDTQVTIHQGGHSGVENAADLLAKLLETLIASAIKPGSPPWMFYKQPMISPKHIIK